MIERLFSSQILFSILDALFSEGRRSLSTSEIIAKVKKNQANISRELEKLASYGFVLKEKKGNQNFYILNSENQYFDILVKLFKAYKANQHRGYQKVWSRRPYPPSVMAIVARATVDGFSQLFPSHIKVAGNFWEHEENTYFYEKNEIESTVSDLISEAFKNPARIISFFEKSYEKATDLKNYSEKYIGSDISKIPTDTLIDFYLELMKKFYDTYSYGTVQILIGYSEDNQMYKKAYEIIASKIKDSPKKFSEYFISLSSVPKKLEVDYQNLDILRIAKEAKKFKLASKEQIIKKFQRNLAELVKKYTYISYDLKNSAPWDIAHYASLVYEKITVDINKEIKEIEQYEERVEERYRQAAKSLRLSKQELVIFGILRSLGYYKWAREYGFIHALYNVKPVQDEIAKRYGMSGIDFRFLLPEEVKTMVQNPKKYRKEIQERRKHFFVWTRPGNIIESHSGDDAIKYIRSIAFTTKNTGTENADVLKGTPASTGKVRGTVTIVNIIKHVDKMTEGNVLVSIATTPDLLPAMKKAIAIITDEGGVTCHAAIVSRELKIPCVVGTKIATKVLSDGDEVEVDASNGVVTVLKRV